MDTMIRAIWNGMRDMMASQMARAESSDRAMLLAASVLGGPR